MKKYITIILGLGLSLTNAQIFIGEGDFQSQDSLIEFEEGKTNGIILPAVDSVLQPNEGLLFLDKKDKKVKYLTSDDVVNLTVEGEISNLEVNDSEDKGQGVLISSNKDSDFSRELDGVLTLEGKDKAMLLPRVEDVLTDVKSPYPGTICYDIKTKSIAIFNGEVWQFFR